MGAREIGASEYKSWLVKWSSATTLVGSGREAATAHACNLSACTGRNHGTGGHDEGGRVAEWGIARVCGCVFVVVCVCVCLQYVLGASSLPPYTSHP